MRRRRSLPIFFSIGVSVCGALLFVACSSPAPTKSKPLTTYDDDDAGSTTKRDSASSDISPEQDPPLPDGGTPPGFVYAHTAKNLYLFEPISEKLTLVGPFACLEGADRMLDIALDRDGVMYGTSDNGFLSINATSGACTYVKKDAFADYPNSLSFVPLGTVDATKETLVGYQFDPNTTNQATVYSKIDLVTGEMTKIGDLNAPNAAIKYKSSGDLIALIRNGNKAFLTVKRVDTDAGAGTDSLAEVDPTTGQLIRIVGDIQKSNLYGFGFWAGTGYGFSGQGEILKIDMTTGAATKIMDLKEDGGVVAWFGAGVKTLAPTAPTQ